MNGRRRSRLVSSVCMFVLVGLYYYVERYLKAQEQSSIKADRQHLHDTELSLSYVKENVYHAGGICIDYLLKLSYIFK